MELIVTPIFAFHQILLLYLLLWSITSPDYWEENIITGNTLERLISLYLFCFVHECLTHDSLSHTLLGSLGQHTKCWYFIWNSHSSIVNVNRAVMYMVKIRIVPLITTILPMNIFQIKRLSKQLIRSQNLLDTFSYQHWQPNMKSVRPAMVSLTNR